MAITINIAKEFTETPGPRYIADGEYSGEEFYKKILKPKFQEVIDSGGKDKLEINFDGTFGYPPSFISEAFGRLYSDFKEQPIFDYLIIISEEDRTIAETIKKSMKEYE